MNAQDLASAAIIAAWYSAQQAEDERNEPLHRIITAWRWIRNHYHH